MCSTKYKVRLQVYRFIRFKRQNLRDIGFIKMDRSLNCETTIRELAYQSRIDFIMTRAIITII